MKNSKEIDIAQKLIRCKSIAPKDGGTLRIVEKDHAWYQNGWET